jgi:hypothetical protein
VVDVEGRPGDDVLVVQIRRHTDDPPRPGPDIDELHDGIGPHQPAIDRLLTREHPLCETLAHDHHALGAAVVRLGEVTPRKDRHAKRCKEAGRDGAELRAGVLFAVGPGVAFG